MITGNAADAHSSCYDRINCFSQFTKNAFPCRYRCSDGSARDIILRVHEKSNTKLCNAIHALYTLAFGCSDCSKMVRLFASLTPHLHSIHTVCSWGLIVAIEHHKHAHTLRARRKLHCSNCRLVVDLCRPVQLFYGAFCFTDKHSPPALRITRLRNVLHIFKLPSPNSCYPDFSSQFFFHSVWFTFLCKLFGSGWLAVDKLCIRIVLVRPLRSSYPLKFYYY